MKDKLLFWIPAHYYFFNFCIAKCISEKYDCDIHTIIDTDNEKKTFFEKQQLIHFKTIWYYRDHVDLNPQRIPDINYLKDFEHRTGINLWNIAYSERQFYNFNTYYQFSHNEILSILEQECKLFEKILDKVNPDFLVIGVTDKQHNYLLSEICKSRKIRVLMSGAARFGLRELISEEADIIDGNVLPNYHEKSQKEISFEELQEFFDKFNFIKQINKIKKTYTYTNALKIKKFFKLVFIYGDKKYQNHFDHRGMTRWNLMKKIPILKFKQWRVRRYVNKIFTKTIDQKSPFIYFPLHSEPERALSIAAPFFTNQIEVITNVAKSIPIGYLIYVKDHPIMAVKGERTLEFYKKIKSLPNVRLIHPSISQDNLIKQCSIVVTIGGTAGLEAAIFGKSSVVFSKTMYSSLPSVHEVKNINELPSTIRKSLQTKVNPNDVKTFIDFIDKNSFQVDKGMAMSDLRARVHHKEISEDEMLKFLKDYEPELDILSSEHIKKINEIKAKELSSKN